MEEEKKHDQIIGMSLGRQEGDLFNLLKFLKFVLYSSVNDLV